MTTTLRRARTASDSPLARSLITFFLLVTVFALALTGVGAFFQGDVSAAVMAVLWALGGLFFGMVAGFLFGIPKIIQGTGSNARPEVKGQPDSQQYQQQVNTNLVEISDWLTKIIVGLGLIELKESPAFIIKASSLLSKSLATVDSKRDSVAFAIAVICLFPCIGFLISYLVTRLYLSQAFADADLRVNNRQALQAQVASLEAGVSVLSKAVTGASKEMVFQESVTGIDVSSLEDPIKQRLEKLAKQYNEFRSNDKGERVRVRYQLADEWARFLFHTVP